MAQLEKSPELVKAIGKIDEFLKSNEYVTTPINLAVTCCVCYMPIINKNEFKAHIAQHNSFADPAKHSTLTQLHCCFSCGLAFSSAREYRTHHDEYHPFSPQPIPGSNVLKNQKKR